MILVYITDRNQFPGNQKARQQAALAKIAQAAGCGVDLVQLREKGLSARELESLAREAIRVIRENSATGTGNREPVTRLLINSRSDIALACGADGVHLRSDDISPSKVRTIWTQPGRSTRPLVTVSCHSVDDVAHAASEGADFALFAPIFGKPDAPHITPAGLDGLREACRQKIPVIALGGITLDNARACVDAGAAGIASIRLFQQNDIAEVVRRLRD